MGRNRRERARLKRKHERVRTWAVGVAVIVVVGGGVISLRHNLAGSGDARPVGLGASPTVEQLAAPAVGPPPTPVVGPLPTPASQVQRITAEDTRALLEKGQAVLYDVRSAEAYQGRHAVGAISFPEAQLETSLATVPVDKKLIYYCA